MRCFPVLCICKPAINRLLFIPAILIGLFPMCAFLIPGCETMDRFWMVFLGIDNAFIGIYFLMVCPKRTDTTKKHFLVKGIEFIAIGAALSVFGSLIGWWQSSFVTADTALPLQVSLWAFPCAAYLLLIVLAIWNYCSPQFLPSLRLKACMLDNDDFAKQHVI